MSRVFLLERPRANIDVSQAEAFGELTLVFDSQDRRQSIFRCRNFGLDILERLSNAGFDPARDHFCVTGGMVPVSIALTAIVVRYGSVRALFYNASQSVYVERTVGFDSWKGQSNGRANVGEVSSDEGAPRGPVPPHVGAPKTGHVE